MTMASHHRTAPPILFNKRDYDDPRMFENPVAQAKRSTNMSKVRPLLGKAHIIFPRRSATWQLPGPVDSLNHSDCLS